jgi:hypothetical protein
MDNGVQHEELIRCTPKFHNRQRFDTVLVQMPEQLLPARLHLIFEVEAHEKLWKLARVTYFTPITRSAVDKMIGMWRYEESDVSYTILLENVARSCYMTPIDGQSSHNLFYLNDCIAGDIDLFLRIAAMIE